VAVQVLVGDRATWKSPEHPFRTDERLAVSGIPTLVHWTADGVGERLGALGMPFFCDQRSCSFGSRYRGGMHALKLSVSLASCRASGIQRESFRIL